MTDGGNEEAVHRIELAIERLDGRMQALSELKALDHRRLEERIEVAEHHRRKTDQANALISEKLDQIPHRGDYTRIEHVIEQLVTEVKALPDRDDYDRLAKALEETDRIARANQIGLAKLGALMSLGGGVGGLVVVALQQVLGG